MLLPESLSPLPPQEIWHKLGNNFGGSHRGKSQVISGGGEPGSCEW